VLIAGSGIPRPQELSKIRFLNTDPLITEDAVVATAIRRWIFRTPASPPEFVPPRKILSPALAAVDSLSLQPQIAFHQPPTQRIAWLPADLDAKPDESTA
jgi:hypothetical protein